MSDIRHSINLVEAMSEITVKGRPVFTNPSKRDMIGLYRSLQFPKEGLRATIDAGDLLVWDGYYATHDDVLNSLHLVEPPPLWLHPDKLWLNGSGADDEQVEDWVAEIHACACLRRIYGANCSIEIERDLY